VREQAEALKHVADRTPQRDRVALAHVDTSDPDPSALHLQQAIDQLQQGGFSRARRPDHHRQLPGVHLEADLRQNDT